MDYLSEALIGFLFLIVGAIARYLNQRLNTMSEQIYNIQNKVSNHETELTNEVNNMKVKLSENYTTKQEFMRLVDVIFAKIDQSNNKIDQKIDNFDKKFDDKITELTRSINDKKDKYE